MSTPISKNTTLLPRIRQRVKNLCKTIIKEKLTPWRSFKFHSVNITDFYGEIYPIGGGDMAYEGSIESSFFFFIVPFLEDAIVNTLDETLETCRIRGLKPEQCIRDTAMILEDYLIGPIYDEMADIDRHLRCRDGNLKSVKRRDVTDEIDKMVKFLDKNKDELIQGIKEQNGISNQSQEKAGQGKMDIFSKLAVQFEEFKKQIEKFLDEIYTRVACFENLNTEQQQSLIYNIANTGIQFHDKFNSIHWGIDFEDAVFELQKAKHENLVKDLKERFDRLSRSLEDFFPYGEKNIFNKIEEFTTFDFAICIGEALKENIRYFRCISEQVINVPPHPRAETYNETTQQEKSRQGNVGKADSPNDKTSERWFWRLFKTTIAIFRKIPNWIYILTLFLAALLTCLSLLGWLEPIKEFIYKLFIHQ